MSGCIALIVGAGRSHRFGGDIPKQYSKLLGLPMINRTIAAFALHPVITSVRVVINPDDKALYLEAIKHQAPFWKKEWRNGQGSWVSGNTPL